MSEKRFECVFKEHETKNSWSMIKDNQLDKPLYIKDVVDLLNEKQSIIEEMQKRIDELENELNHIHDCYEANHGISIRNSDWYE